jgi:hypothetical protein
VAGEESAPCPMDGCKASPGISLGAECASKWTIYDISKRHTKGGIALRRLDLIGRMLQVWSKSEPHQGGQASSPFRRCEKVHPMDFQTNRATQNIFPCLTKVEDHSELARRLGRRCVPFDNGA